MKDVRGCSVRTWWLGTILSHIRTGSCVDETSCPCISCSEFNSRSCSACSLTLSLPSISAASRPPCAFAFFPRLGRTCSVTRCSLPTGCASPPCPCNRALACQGLQSGVHPFPSAWPSCHCSSLLPDDVLPVSCRVISLMRDLVRGWVRENFRGWVRECVGSLVLGWVMTELQLPSPDEGLVNLIKWIFNNFI